MNPLPIDENQNSPSRHLIKFLCPIQCEAKLLLSTTKVLVDTVTEVYVTSDIRD